MRKVIDASLCDLVSTYMYMVESFSLLQASMYAALDYVHNQMVMLNSLEITATCLVVIFLHFLY